METIRLALLLRLSPLMLPRHPAIWGQAIPSIGVWSRNCNKRPRCVCVWTCQWYASSPKIRKETEKKAEKARKYVFDPKGKCRTAWRHSTRSRTRSRNKKRPQRAPAWQHNGVKSSQKQRKKQKQRQAADSQWRRKKSKKESRKSEKTERMIENKSRKSVCF